ncbi:hypothetical protein B0H11DRAFT_2264798 [Mycena galericulata]|nr:hypothetical protein B0H11DRAFT_2264798 [Mycena galericulata]
MMWYPDAGYVAPDSYPDENWGSGLPLLAEFTPTLNPLTKELSGRFRTSLAKHRIRVCKTILQPLATNGEREMTLQGMQRALADFDQQMGIEPEGLTLRSWHSGNLAYQGDRSQFMRVKSLWSGCFEGSIVAIP